MFKLALLLFLVGASFVYAQGAPESLLISPGDEIHIRVFDTPELEQSVRVSDAGVASLILGGDIKVAALTVTQAARAIEAQLVERKIMLHPQVEVNIVEYATAKVSVLGEVKHPGAYFISTPRSIVDVLTLAGGLTEIADPRVVIERHLTGEKVPYFLSNDAGTAFDSAVKVNPGDSVIVSRAGIVFAIGDFRAPGGYTMTNNQGQLTLLQLVARAGGYAKTAGSHGKLLRRSKGGTVEIPIDIRAISKGKQADIALMQDDIVFIPFSYMRNMVITSTSILATAGNAAVYRF